MNNLPILATDNCPVLFENLAQFVVSETKSSVIYRFPPDIKYEIWSNERELKLLFSSVNQMDYFNPNTKEFTAKEVSCFKKTPGIWYKRQ